MISFGIIGSGYVGGATALFECERVKCFKYDIDPKKCSPANCTLNDIINCDLIFICVPTPQRENGECNLSIVESVVVQLRNIDPNCSKIVIRSTVPPFTSKRLGTHSMPEFLTEKNWRKDFKERNSWVIGVNEDQNPNYMKAKITELVEVAQEARVVDNKDMIFCLSEEAETMKYVRNCFLATKVAFFNEISSFCKEKEINYEKVRTLTGLDPRIGLSHTQVPGPDGKPGFGGTCFPKDLSALIYEFEHYGIKTEVLKSIEKRNSIDREK